MGSALAGAAAKSMSGSSREQFKKLVGACYVSSDKEDTSTAVHKVNEIGIL